MTAQPELLIKSWKKIDYFFFLLFIPVLLLSIFLLPDSIKNHFILKTSNPTLLSMFLSNYVHLNILHFLGNVLAYFFIIFLILNFETNRKLLYTTSLLMFLIMPFVSSFLLIRLFPTLPPSLGFSAIVAGFMGYLVYSSYKYVKIFFYTKINLFLLYLVLMINLIVVAYNLKTPFRFQLFIFAISIILVYFNKIAIKEIWKQIILKTKNLLIEKLIRRLIYYYLLFVLTIFSIFYLPNLIPSNIIEGGSLINIFSHYIGYIFGLFVPIIIDRFMD